MISRPWLLYCYSWMPYPRRVIIYLRERNIPSSTVTVVPVTDPGPDGNKVLGDFPPKPPGSLPILAVPDPSNEPTSQTKPAYTYIGESLAIISYLEDACAARFPGFPPESPTFHGSDMQSRARISEALSVANDLTSSWNPVRMFGTKAGTMAYPEGSKEMLRWVRRLCMAAERQLAEHGKHRFNNSGDGPVTIADIALFQFLEFTNDCYGVNMALGSGKIVNDVYGREVKEEFSHLMTFFKAFSARPSAKRIESLGEVPPKSAFKNMATWHDGIL